MNFLNWGTLGCVFLGGGFGALVRFVISFLVLKVSGRIWTGTFVVNILGCIILYVLVKNFLTEIREINLFLKIGFLGSLTTFSTFSLEIVELFKKGSYLEAGIVLFLNVFFGIIIGIGILR